MKNSPAMRSAVRPRRASGKISASRFESFAVRAMRSQASSKRSLWAMTTESAAMSRSVNRNRYAYSTATPARATSAADTSKAPGSAPSTPPTSTPVISPANSAAKPRAKERAASPPPMRPMMRNSETSTEKTPR